MKNRCVQLCYVTWLPGELRSGNICRGIHKKKKIIHLFFTVTLHLLWERQAQTTTVLQPFSHSLGPDWGKAIWLPDHLYTALSGNGFSDSDLFFLCLCSLSPLWRLREERERERGGEKKKKTSLTEAQSIISQVFDWSDCKRSRQFPRALDWDGLELARNKTQFSRSEETAVLNKTRQRMQKKRLPAEDKVESWLLFSFSLHSPVTHSLSYSLVF